MPISNLWVVMPVYNEEECIDFVVNEWLAMLNSLHIKYTLCILNDGSKDNTLQRLTALQETHNTIHVVNKSNSGHGQTCVEGYKLALEQGADWIFQIDSDGQCDPKFFSEFLNRTQKHKNIYGVRKTRDDGLQRIIVSHFVSLFTFVATGQWLRDPNVPYRLMHADSVRTFAYNVPKDFHLANILVTVRSNKFERIRWVPIHFRDRMGGTASVKTFSFIKHGMKLFKQLRAAQNSLI